MARDKVVPAYSGELDTCVIVPWIGEKFKLHDGRGFDLPGLLRHEK